MGVLAHTTYRVYFPICMRPLKKSKIIDLPDLQDKTEGTRVRKNDLPVCRVAMLGMDIRRRHHVEEKSALARSDMLLGLRCRRSKICCTIQQSRNRRHLIPKPNIFRCCSRRDGPRFLGLRVQNSSSYRQLPQKTRSNEIRGRGGECSRSARCLISG